MVKFISWYMQRSRYRFCRNLTICLSLPRRGGVHLCFPRRGGVGLNFSRMARIGYAEYQRTVVTAIDSLPDDTVTHVLH